MFIQPMLLLSKDTVKNDPDKLYERKYNGFRMLLYVDGSGKTKLYTRMGNEITTRFPEFLNLELPPDTYLDGECVFMEDGKENFEAVMIRFRMTKEITVNMAAKEYPCTFKVFDILRFKKDIRMSPLIERKQLLSSLPIKDPAASIVEYTNDGVSLYSQVANISGEGIVEKSAYSPYLSGKRAHWNKIIAWHYEIAAIIGYRKEEFAILCELNSNGKIGNVEFGMSPDEKQAFYGVSKDIISRETESYIYLEPFLKCRLKGRGYTSKGFLFTPVFDQFITS